MKKMMLMAGAVALAVGFTAYAEEKEDWFDAGISEYTEFPPTTLTDGAWENTEGATLNLEGGAPALDLNAPAETPLTFTPNDAAVIIDEEGNLHEVEVTSVITFEAFDEVPEEVPEDAKGAICIVKDAELDYAYWYLAAGDGENEWVKYEDGSATPKEPLEVTISLKCEGTTGEEALVTYVIDGEPIVEETSIYLPDPDEEPTKISTVNFTGNGQVSALSGQAIPFGPVPPPVEPVLPGQTVTVTADSEEAALAKCEIAATSPDESVITTDDYKGYFKLVAKDNEDGTFDVSCVLDEEKLDIPVSVVEIAGQLTTFTTSFELTNAKPGLYYSVLQSATELKPTSEGERTMADAEGAVSVKATKFENKGMYILKVSTDASDPE